jgi:chromosome segregation ATPase
MIAWGLHWEPPFREERPMVDTSQQMQKIVEAAKGSPGLVLTDYPVEWIEFPKEARAQNEDMARLRMKLRNQRKNLRDLNKAHVQTLHDLERAWQRMKGAEASAAYLREDLNTTRTALAELQGKIRQAVG